MIMDRSWAALIVFIRNPKPGTGKTRIAATTGEEQAFRIYLELLAHTRNLAVMYPGPKYLYYSEFIDREDRWDNKLFQKRVQAAGDLGEKMASAFEEVLKENQGAIIIGSDCPGLGPEDLEAASRKLAQSDVVIGPSEDGGYYLLGMRAFCRSLFSGIPWSSPDTYAKTVEKAGSLNLQVERLRLLYDIDTVNDWQRWKNLS